MSGKAAGAKRRAFCRRSRPNPDGDVKMKDIPKIAALDFVSLIDYLPTAPLSEPTDDGVYLYADKFARWLALWAALVIGHLAVLEDPAVSGTSHVIAGYFLLHRSPVFASAA